MQTESKDPVPTASEQDIFLRWVAKAKDRNNYFSLEHNVSYTSSGTVFGKPATARGVHCMGNSFIDLWVSLPGETFEGIRVIIYYSSLQTIQLYYGYGLTDAPVNLDRCVPFQSYALDQLIKFIKDMVV